MKTTRKQLVNFAIGLVKEVSKQNKNINVQYKNSGVAVWFHYNETSCECIDLYYFVSLKINKAKFKKAILKIRGIIV